MSKIFSSLAVMSVLVLSGCGVDTSLTNPLASKPVLAPTVDSPAANEPLAPDSSPADSNDQVGASEVILNTPAQNQMVGKTFAVQGSAPGYWFFEANLPIEILDKNNKLILQTSTMAKGEWMTEQLVNFETNITLPTGTPKQLLQLVIKKDNPSGEAKFDQSHKIWINYSL